MAEKKELNILFKATKINKFFGDFQANVFASPCSRAPPWALNSQTPSSRWNSLTTGAFPYSPNGNQESGQKHNESIV